MFDKSFVLTIIKRKKESKSQLVIGHVQHIFRNYGITQNFVEQEENGIPGCMTVLRLWQYHQQKLMQSGSFGLVQLHSAGI